METTETKTKGLEIINVTDTNDSLMKRDEFIVFANTPKERYELGRIFPMPVKSKAENNSITFGNAKFVFHFNTKILEGKRCWSYFSIPSEAMIEIGEFVDNLNATYNLENYFQMVDLGIRTDGNGQYWKEGQEDKKETWISNEAIESLQQHITENNEKGAYKEI